MTILKHFYYNVYYRIFLVKQWWSQRGGWGAEAPPTAKNSMEIRGKRGRKRKKREIKRKRSGWRMEEGEGDEPLPP